MQFFPWALAAVTAALLGWLSYRSGGGWALWAIGGALYSLVVSTIIIGLFHAAFIPLSESAETTMNLKAGIFSVVLTAALIAFVTRQMWGPLFFRKKEESPAKKD